MNRKALRTARRVAAKGLRTSTASPTETNLQGQGADSLELEDSIVYQCCICCDDLPLAKGVVPCEAHFICNECVVDAFDAALNNTELFPAKCCTTIPRRLVEHLLRPEVIESYKARAKEYYTSRVLRVYCVNNDCRRFIPEDNFDNNHAWYTIARCDCGTDTCVGCKQAWEGENHRCRESEERDVKPEWLPEYSESCCIKQCPMCRVWIEHKEACNHMTCCYCRHEFCFVCLQPWTGEGFHDDQGCPSYGDPSAGYDEDGFEQSARGLHRDTGYDRDGFNRFGQERMGYILDQEEGYSEDNYDYLDNQDQEIFEPGDEIIGGDLADDDNGNDLADRGEEAAEHTGYLELTEDPAVHLWRTEGLLTDTISAWSIDEYDWNTAVGNDPIKSDELNPSQVHISSQTSVASDLPLPRVLAKPDEHTCQSLRRARRVPIFAPNPDPSNRGFRVNCPRFS